jgi:hypothetical protein
MKKAFLILTIVLIVIAAAVFYVFSNLDSIVEAAIEELGSDAVKTSVQVEKVETWLTEGTAVITGLTVANPDGFSLPQAFSLAEIGVGINLEKTNKEVIAIDVVSVAAPRVFYEINAERQGSLNILKDNLASGGEVSADTPADGGAPTESGAAPVKLDIARFVFRDASLHAKVVPLNDKTYDLKLPPLVLTNLTGTPEQISRQVLEKLIDHAKQEIQKQGLDQELSKIEAKAQQRIDEEKARLEQMTDEQIEEEKQKVQDKLKNLLDR